MNWTGGNLHRQTKANKNGVLARQKQHFANVRTNLQHEQPPTVSFEPSFLYRGPDLISRNPETGYRTRYGARQKTLEDFTNVAPVAARLSSIAPRRHRSPPYTVQSKISTKSVKTIDRPYADKMTFRPDDFAFSGGTSGPTWSAVSSETQRAFSERRNPLPTLTTSAQRQKQKRSPLETNNQQYPDDAEEYEHRRRKLLGRSDWIELDSAKPFHMEFMSDRGEARVAKRRKLVEADEVRKRGAVHCRTRLPSIGDKVDDYMMSGALNPKQLTRNESIRIRIGDAALASQTDTMSRAEPQRVTTVSSEPLLLDEFDENSEQYMAESSLGPDKQHYSSMGTTNDNARSSDSQSAQEQPNQAQALKSWQELPHVSQIEAGSEIYHTEGHSERLVEMHNNGTDAGMPRKEILTDKQESVPQYPLSSSSVDSISNHAESTPANHARHISVLTTEPNLHYAASNTQLSEPGLTEGEHTWRKVLDIYNSDGETSNSKKSGPAPLATSANKRTSGCVVMNTRATNMLDGLSAVDKPNQEPNHNSTAKSRQCNSAQDLDAIWKAFVFGSRADSPCSSLDEASLADGKDPASSMSVQIPPSPYEQPLPFERKRNGADDSSIMSSTTSAITTAHDTMESFSSHCGRKQKTQSPPGPSSVAPSASGQHGLALSSASFDCPSSIANASTTAAVLSERRANPQVVRATSYLAKHGANRQRGKLGTEISIFRRPRPLLASRCRSGDDDCLGREEPLEDEIVDSD